MSQFDNTPIRAPEILPPTHPSLSGNEQTMAIASIVIGIIGLCSSFVVGLCASPFPIVGLILGYLALKDPNQKTLAIVGMAISGLTLLLVCLLIVIAGGLTIMGPVIENVFSGIN